MMGRLLFRFVIFGLLALVVARALRRFLAGFRQGVARGQPPPPAAKAAVMARDPVCGTFVVPGSALAVRAGSGTVYFCSDKCRQAYLSRA